MNIKTQICRDGTSQGNRSLRALQPDYVAVDERSIKALLEFAQQYAKKLIYYDESNQPSGNWSSFFAVDVNNIVAYLNDPESFSDEEALKISQPHLVLYITFLQLLRHPQQQFRELTQRYLDFYYKEVLKLQEKPETPDKVNVLIELARGVKEHLIKQGTLLDAGQDSQGVTQNYATDEDIIINQAQIASIKTLHIKETYINLSAIHRQYKRSDEGFEQVLRWAVGQSFQGDKLPPYPDGQEGSTSTNITFVKNIYQQIKDVNSENVTEEKRKYILNQLFFATLEDFKYCFAIHDREIRSQEGEPEVKAPTDLEWNQVYSLLEKAYRKKINWRRRKDLEQERQNSGFDSMMKLALGNPNPSDPLPVLSQKYNTLDDLFNNLNEDTREPAVIRYVIQQLYMSVEDFRKIMTTKNDPDNSDWEEVYRLLEKAQTKKRNFTYPDIGRKETQNIYATSIVESQEGTFVNTQRFKPFTQSFITISQSEKNRLGFAIASPVLLLKEGKRTITLTLSFQQSTFNRDILTTIIDSKTQPFQVYLSTSSGWIESDALTTTFAVGDFIFEEPLKSYLSSELFLQGKAVGEGKLSQNDSNQYILFKDGNIYQIISVENEGNVKLRAAGNIPEATIAGGAFKKYQNISLAGNFTQLTGLSLNEDQQVITAERDSFAKEDKDKFIVWSNKVIYRIQNFNNARSIKVKQWGYLPALGDSNIKKYDSIALNGASNTQFQLEITGICFSDQPQSKTFEFKDVGKLIVWNNGVVLGIGEISERAAKCKIIGRIPIVQIYLNTINQYRPTAIYLNSIQIRLTLDAACPAIVPLTSLESQVVIDTLYPVLKILLKNATTEETSEQTIEYEKLKSICVQKATLQVQAENIQDLQLRNDSSVLNSKSPFQPFGNSPKVGSGFYIANREISRKKLDSLTIRIGWMGLPQNFADHYKAYSNTGVITSPITNDSFKASFKLLNNRSWIDIETPKSLFTQQNNTLSNTTNLNYRFDISGYSIDPNMDELETNNPFDENRYFKLELENPDFGHNLYPIVLNKVALASDDNIKSQTVYAPYTPEFKAISLDYTASVEINLHQLSSSRLFQIHPFGYTNISDEDFLLPQYDYQGALYIGIRNGKAPQDISLFFQMIAGSGDAELVKPNIDWQYLTASGWQNFQPIEILKDSTNGLIDSGIIRLSIPEKASKSNPLLPTGLYWLQATVKENPTAIPDILDIKVQAVSATFVNQGNAPQRLSKPLAANSIQKLTERDSAVATVVQPYSSFKGRMKEDTHAFYTRVSERLRHKQRALTAWDYEHIVLEKFPEIYKAKCLTQAEQPRSASGQVTIVVVPDISNTAPFFPLEPKAPLYLLKEIEEYLKAHTSPFIKLIVKNPRYEQIKYRIAVRFKKGYEIGYYLKQLNEDIKRFLSPWAYEEQADIPFGSSIHSSAVIHFIEKRAYIDYVANIKLIEQISLQGNTSETVTYQVNESNLAQVNHPDSILVSAQDHIIDLITTEKYEEEAFEGIGYMIIGIDFVIA